ncbi:MAG: hypothetical protein IKI63_06660, partial [Clostridia bacterium]|nr:hypothetical protein [Clostridia bacterium]
MKNGKFYGLLTLLTAGALMLVPMTTLPAASEPAAAAASAVPAGVATATTVPEASGAAEAAHARPDIRTEAFSVLHSDGKKVSSMP